MSQAAKHDAGKPCYGTVPTGIIRAVERVRAYGIAKYGTVDGWRQVEPGRYREALLRHVLAWWDDPDAADAESGHSHLWHVACNVAFLIELEGDI